MSGCAGSVGTRGGTPGCRELLLGVVGRRGRGSLGVAQWRVVAASSFSSQLSKNDGFPERLWEGESRFGFCGWEAGRPATSSQGAPPSCESAGGRQGSPASGAAGSHSSLQAAPQLPARLDVDGLALSSLEGPARPLSGGPFLPICGHRQVRVGALLSITCLGSSCCWLPALAPKALRASG